MSVESEKYFFKNLTLRQTEILRLIASEYLTNRQIADRLKISESTATDAAVDSPRGRELGVDQLGREVSPGCPDGYVQSPGGVSRDPALPAIRGRVDQPLSVSTLVFVVGEDEAANLGANGFARAPYESVCEEQHTCSEVTTALFVSRSVLDSPGALTTAMVVGLGIDPTAGRYPNGHP